MADRLTGVLDRESFKRQFMRVCLLQIPEALFARAVILVEGLADQAVLEGCGLRADPLNRNGVVVVDVGGKSNVPLAHALLTELGVPCYTVFDGDADYEDTCRQATVEAESGPPAWLSDIINRVMDLCTEG